MNFSTIREFFEFFPKCLSCGSKLYIKTDYNKKYKLSSNFNKILITDGIYVNIDDLSIFYSNNSKQLWDFRIIHLCIKEGCLMKKNIHLRSEPLIDKVYITSTSLHCDLSTKDIEIIIDSNYDLHINQNLVNIDKAIYSNYREFRNMLKKLILAYSLLE